VSTETPARPARLPRGAPIDPRIRDRRVAVKRREGRRRLRIVLGVLIAFVVAGVVLLVIDSPFLDVDRIDVRAGAHARAGEIRRAARVSTGDPLLLVNLGAVRERVEQLPWVKRAKVQRDLPSRLRITVTERTAVAWSRRSAERVTLIDATGRVLGDQPQPPPGVPQLVVPNGLAHPGANVQPVDELRVIAQLPAVLRVRVASLVLVRGEATLQLAFGPQVRLGAPDNVNAKARAVLAVLASFHGPSPRYVDVRVPAAPVSG
jgi:cell division protein FtsQ